MKKIDEMSHAQITQVNNERCVCDAKMQKCLILILLIERLETIRHLTHHLLIRRC